MRPGDTRFYRKILWKVGGKILKLEIEVGFVKNCFSKTYV